MRRTTDLLFIRRAPVSVTQPSEDLITRRIVGDLGNSRGASFIGEYNDAFATLTFYVTNTKGGYSRPVFSTSDLILTDVNESESEKADPIYTFGVPVVFSSFGTQPKVYIYQVRLLMNKGNGDTRSELIKAYQTYGRGTSAVTPQTEEYYVQLSYKNRLVRGVLLSLDVPLSSNELVDVAATFSMFVYDERVV